MSQAWTWSQSHRNYYMVTYDASGKPIYHWAQQSQPSVPKPAQSGYTPQPPDYPNHVRVDSGSDPYPQNRYQNYDPNPAQAPEYPEPVSDEIRSRLPGLIPGTPQLGWYERLDSSYRMRTGAEARQFFRKGRVFSMLYSEAASETMAKAGSDNDAVTVIKFGEYVYSQIRRFVVVEVKRHFVYACAISTYSGRATNKQGCNPAEHAPVYLSGSKPIYFQGEYQNGMDKEPIEIVPADSSITIDAASRLRFGKTYPIEWNVKIKDIGMVHPDHLSKLIMYWEEEN